MSWNHFAFSVSLFICTQYVRYNAMQNCHFSHFAAGHISHLCISQLAANKAASSSLYDSGVWCWDILRPCIGYAAAAAAPARQITAQPTWLQTSVLLLQSGHMPGQTKGQDSLSS